MKDIILNLTYDEAVRVGLMLESRKERLNEITLDGLEPEDLEILKKDIGFADSIETKLKTAICKSVTDDPTARVDMCYNVITGGTLNDKSQE